MSRVLQRLRGVFGDQLLVRTRGGYTLTARARRLQEELRVLLPRIDGLLRGDTSIQKRPRNASACAVPTICLGCSLHGLRSA